jgi:hydrophobe/amphiphile efflux-1 (HAE1) family protein
MKLSDFHHQDLPSLSIRRPILIIVINLLIVLAGIMAILNVEVRELPNVDRPIITVRANYPGASPETMDAEVTSLLEGAVARVSGVKSIRPSSEENNMRMQIEFSPSVDLDQAAADVREAISRVQRRLPEDVEQLTVIKADADATPIIRLAASSTQFNDSELTRFLEQSVVPDLISVMGVADVTLFGTRQQLLRVAIDPIRLNSFGLSISDVINVLRTAPLDVPAGSFRSDDQELLVRADASAISEIDIAHLQINHNVKIGDIARVIFAPADATSYVRFNGDNVIGLGIIRQAHSNTIMISNEVQKVVDKLNQRFDHLTLSITSDEAKFIRDSVREVLMTLLLSVLIVILTLWLFMGRFTVTLIPSITIPIALIGTIAAIWLFGFSLNILTLLALVLATGLVVDDAIVVLENIQRHRAQGLGTRAAAVLATRQVFFAVVATTAVLISVFIPIAFLPSTAGRLFREFGLVLAVAVGLSSFVALSLVPALAARLPKEPDQHYKGRLLLIFLGEKLALFYQWTLKFILSAWWLAIILALLAVWGAWQLSGQLKQELLPSEDRGILYVSATGPDGVGLGYTERQVDYIEAVLQPLLDSGEISALFTIVGRFDLNRAHITAPLADWELRGRSQQDMINTLRPILLQIPGARIGVFGTNSLNLRGTGGGIEMALLGNNYPYLYEVTKQFTQTIESELPYLSQPDISYQPTQPQLSIKINRQRAEDLGINLNELSTTLRSMISGYNLLDLNVGDQAIPLFIESMTGRIRDPSDLMNLQLKNKNDQLIPLSSLIELVEEGIAAELDRHAQRRAIEVSLELAPTHAMQTAINDLQQLAAKTLPDDVSLIFLGEAATLEETSYEIFITYGIALLVVFLVLAAQFENITSAIIVSLTIPFGVAAAIYALFLTDTSINIYSQIGLVMLIGLMAKNGILLVEFADQLRDRGETVYQAVMTSARVRLRPIVMTLLSTVIGGLPLILSTGAGAEARMAMGWVIFGGLGLAAVFTLYLTPVFYLGLARLSPPRATEMQRLTDELIAAELNQKKMDE